MIPTLQPNQIVLGISFNKNNIRPSQIIAFTYHGKLLIKRVLGISGETIILEDGTVKADGKQRFVLEKQIPQYYEWNVADSQVCVLGDNPTNSLDSRKIGLIPIDSIKYRVVARIWPPRLL